MTDKKEIIVHGVDVSECNHILPLENGVYECIAGTKQCLKYRVCECNHNCNFKRLKRKEQECEEINLTNERLIAEKYALKEEILRLKKKKKENEKFYLIKYANKDSYCLELEHERNQYKQALDEIEQYRIAEINDEDEEETDTILNIIRDLEDEDQ